MNDFLYFRMNKINEYCTICCAYLGNCCGDESSDDSESEDVPQPPGVITSINDNRRQETVPVQTPSASR